MPLQPFENRAAGVLLGYAHVNRSEIFAAARQLAGAVRESIGRRDQGLQARS